MFAWFICIRDIGVNLVGQGSAQGDLGQEYFSYPTWFTMPTEKYSIHLADTFSSEYNTLFNKIESKVSIHAGAYVELRISNVQRETHMFNSNYNNIYITIIIQRFMNNIH